MPSAFDILGFSPYVTRAPELARLTGMHGVPAMAMLPGLADDLMRIYEERAAALSFIPRGWIDTVRFYHGKDGYILVPIPKPTQSERPGFLATDGAKEAWRQFAERVRAAVMKANGNRLAEGRAELARAYNDVAFWTFLEKTARVLALPVTAPLNAVEHLATRSVAGPLILSGIGIVAGLALLRKLAPKK